KGCFGLVTIRIGKDPYSMSNFWFTDVADAAKKAKDIGTAGRVFAIQYDGAVTTAAVVDPNYRSRVKWTARQASGNHATWFQIAPGDGFWEWLGPDGWVTKETDFIKGARDRTVHHARDLPHYGHTVYGVADTPDSAMRAPAEGVVAPKAAP